jgi:hypothetical protein
VLKALEDTPSIAAPFVVLNLLHPFYNDSLVIATRKRLLRECLEHLNRLSKTAGGAVSVCPPKVPSKERAALFRMVEEAASDTYRLEVMIASPQLRRLYFFYADLRTSVLYNSNGGFPMGRTIPSAAVVLMQEEASFSRFRRALRRADQLALDDLFTMARQHVAAAQYASHALPFEVNMLAMLLEEHKEVRRLRGQVDNLLMLRTNHHASTGLIDPGIGFDDDPETEQGTQQ